MVARVSLWDPWKVRFDFDPVGCRRDSSLANDILSDSRPK